ncbi:MAG TPA: CDP-alcohol phosphatidyltransferase family protein [Candidatus Limnocylindrales bacterium]|nr:CDP-alcohol phosphatidyltransferase family protein [Candidatus Limnocylindrales bacterium]
MSGSLVSAATRQRVRDLATPIAKALGRLGLTPNALTVIGFVGTCLAALAAAFQLWLLAGVLVLAFGIFDLFDGTLARATGRATRLGAFLDSTFDRAGEGIAYLGIAAGLLAFGFGGGALIAGAAMAAAFMVSYARAKAESLGFASGSGLAAVGLAPREVRIVILTVGLLAAGLIPVHPVVCVSAPCQQPIGTGLQILIGSLLLIAVLATITTIQRMAHVARAPEHQGRQPEPRQAKEA